MEKEIATFAEFAARLGCKRSYVTELHKADRLMLTDDGKVKVAESIARIEATRDPAKAGVSARHAAARGTALASGTGQGEAPPAARPRVDDESVDDSESFPGSSNFQHWKERNERAKALAGERENAVAEGKLMNAGEVERTVADAITALRARLETLPDTLSPQLASIDDESRIRALLAGEIEHALDECSRRFAALGKKEIA